MTRLPSIVRFVPTCLLMLAISVPAFAQGADCTQCHGDLANRKVVHAAVQMGCPTCHADLDATQVPHKSKGKFAKGLKAEGSALCTTCHSEQEKAATQPLAHAAVTSERACLRCHQPHTGRTKTLLHREGLSQTCFACHDRRMFAQKFSHPDDLECADVPRRPR